MTARGETAWTLQPSVPLPLPGSLQTGSPWGPEWAGGGSGAAFSKIMTHQCLCSVFGAGRRDRPS